MHFLAAAMNLPISILYLESGKARFASKKIGHQGGSLMPDV
jgi:hypothetical protein